MSSSLNHSGFIQGDCLEVLATLPAGCADLVFGSPPYEQARLYLEDGSDLGIARDTEQWTAWMVDVFRASLRVCKGLVAFVVAGQTRGYRWSAGPALLMADLHRAGIHLRTPPIFHRVGIPGSGGPDWLRNDCEFIVCATNGGKLPWSDNTIMGEAPKWEPGGDMSYRNADGDRKNAVPGVEKKNGDLSRKTVYRDGPPTMEERKNVGAHRARRQRGYTYVPPERSNPGNVIKCLVGGGVMGENPILHENEAPFPESLAEFFIRSFCPEGGLCIDPFSGSGTTVAVATRHLRRGLGIDLRASQVEIGRQRLASETPMALFGG